MDESTTFLVNFCFFSCVSIRDADTQPAFDITHPVMAIFINTDKHPAQNKTASYTFWSRLIIFQALLLQSS